MTSSAGRVCVSTELIASGRYAAALYAGMTTLTKLFISDWSDARTPSTVELTAPRQKNHALVSSPRHFWQGRSGNVLHTSRGQAVLGLASPLEPGKSFPRRIAD